MVVELHPPALEQLLGGLAVEGAGGAFALVVGLQVLVEMTGVEGVPAVEFGHHRQVVEPVGLQGFVERLGGVGRHAVADLGDGFEFCAALGVGFGGGHGAGHVGMAPGVDHRGVGGDAHGGELVAAGVLVLAQGGEHRVDIILEIEQTLPVDLAVGHRVARRPLLHELGEHAGGVGVVPFLGQLGEDAVAQGAALPVRNDRPAVGVDHVGGHAVRRQCAGVEDAQVVGRVAGELGERGHGQGLGAAFADDQLVVADPHRLVFAEVLERQRAEDGHGVLAGVLLVELGQ